MKIEVEGETEYERFQNLMRGLLAVPRKELKAKLDAENKAKKKKRKKLKSSASGRASKSSP